MWRFTIAAIPIAVLLWMLADGRLWMLVGFALLMGISYGGMVAIAPEVIAHLFGVVGLSGLVGAMYLGAGVGALLGPPVVGWAADASSPSAALGLALGKTSCTTFLSGKSSTITVTPMTVDKPLLRVTIS